MTMCLPFVALLIAAAIDALPSRTIVVLCLAGAVLLAMPSIVAQRSPQAKEDSGWDSVAQLVDHERALDGAGVRAAVIYGTVQYHPRATARVIEYAYPDAFAGSVDVTLDVSAAASGQLWETSRPLGEALDRVADADVVYLLTSVARNDTSTTTSALSGSGWHVAGEWTIANTQVVRYVR